MTKKALSSLTRTTTGDTGSLTYVVDGGNSRSAQLRDTRRFMALDTGDAVTFAGTRIPGNGVSVIGHTAPIEAFGITTPQQHGTSVNSNDGFSLFSWFNGSAGPFHDLNKSRGATPGEHVIVQSGDNIGIWDAGASDGTQFVQSVTLRARVDGTPGTNDMPGRLEIRTTPDGGAASIERVRVSNGGAVTFWGAEVATSSTAVSPAFSNVPVQIHTGQTSNANVNLGMFYWGNDSLQPRFNFYKSRGTSVNTSAILQADDFVGSLDFNGDNGASSFARGAAIRGIVDGTPGATNDMPMRLSFWTAPDGSATIAERLRIANGGNIYAIGAGTTANAANAYIDSSSTPANELLRSTSSARYKREIEDLQDEYADALLSLRPVWYRSAIARDRQDWSWYGLIAEEVANVDPRLVHWGYGDDDWETVETSEGEDTSTERRLKEGATPSPQGVTYDRLTVLLLSIVKRQQQALADCQGRLAALEANRA